MKVLKKGKPPSRCWHKRLMCTGFGRDTEEGCGAVLLVTEEDVFVGDVDPPRNRIIRYEPGRFCCPECGTITDLGGLDSRKCHPRGRKPTQKTLREIRTIWNARHKKRNADTALSKLILAKQKRAEAALRRRELAERGNW